MSGLLSAVVMAVTGIAALGGTPAARPIRLQVHSSEGANIVEVIAEGQGSCKATYQLEVSGNGGDNRSVNRGSVTLPTSGAVAVATVRIASGDSSANVARLTVTPCGGQAYEQVWQSPELSPRG